MVDDLGIRGIQPIDDRTPHHRRRKRGDQGGKFSLEGGPEELEPARTKKRPSARRTTYEPDLPDEEEGNIDIVV